MACALKKTSRLHVLFYMGVPGLLGVHFCKGVPGLLGVLFGWHVLYVNTTKVSFVKTLTRQRSAFSFLFCNHDKGLVRSYTYVI